MKTTVLVTGASSGIGKATAILLAQKGYNVYGAARRTEKMQDLISYGIKPIALDVTQEESMAEVVGLIIKEAGQIDVLVNNAGFGLEGAVEDVTVQDARYQMEVNVFGAMRLAQLVLPKMRENKFGKIINISSVGGKVAFPLGGWYHASKFAIEALSDSLRMEVKPFGIGVIVVEPGPTQSEWGHIATEGLMKISGHTAYKDLAEKAYRSFTKLSKEKPAPMTIAQLIKKGIEATRPKTRYIAKDTTSRFLLFLKRLLPDRLLDKLIINQLEKN